ncbi:lactoylglutathione lyase [Haloarcula quadrata]|uniref:Lactoyglutathione lyase n=3 Tax=Haloarcula TaxID=2237 RepID=Q5UZJ5_HALMA|nr:MULTISPECIES: VOC family protein [Haloarcula]AAV47308.1 putative lactoyglutathione lyase [Haloarcula marismortui ATCC 43049]EMA14691.1 lactoyglutathione lyase [Haloarcula sinaiiensis ATCC 33800]NHX39988.1 VOC family protein [Haloarcula sp. R1-2]QCP92013.1 VOC family protein [Haloarcula marismortui ATCC 43049]QUJ71901.1 VOC family protein [Haloarcula sinaiiensis ATCC 33800]
MDLAHTAICVSDLDRAMEFYDALGFEETNRFTLDGVENVYLGRDGDGDLQLRHDPDRTTPVAPNRADVDHIAFTVDDVAETFETAIDAGAAPVLEPTEVDAADAFAAFVEDPEGYTLEFYHWL